MRQHASRDMIPHRWRRALLAFALPLATLLIPSATRAAGPADPASMAVSVVKAKAACFVDTLQLSGIVAPRDEVLVRPDAEGLQVAQILVEDGAWVGVGQPLAQLVRPDWMPGAPAKATLTAGAKGVLTYRQLPVGMPVSARGEAMFRIIRDGELELVVDLPQAALAKVKPGQTAHIETLDSVEIAGTVRLILPEIDPRTQVGRARIQMRGNAGAKPGAFATVAIDTGRSCGAAVPLSAILYGPQGSIVQVVRDNRIETRRVSVGLLEGHDAEIREGLAAGDTVVARAGSFLREGDLVRPMP
ncbi:efflux RND transporter periplasmic adaptor subunit [Methylocapsa aurea]|uniref:efflux RND transporter periplasmic adaptor subunit n=1 Tax=Methylocapsa aurea TaxID=663610 RepID=UPI001FD9B512|nr:efflux RND transporter periplasmic adaptor subunit [Methylocapsa aurea]